MMRFLPAASASVSPHRAAIACLIGLAVSVPAGAQDRRVVRIAGGQFYAGALSDVVFANAPFSADAVTTVTQTLADGTKIEQRTTARWYRDSSGRVRREQTVIGLDRLNPSAQPQTTITFDSVPGDPQPYVLNPAARTARRGLRGIQWLTLRNGSSSLPLAYTVYASGQGRPDSNLWISTGRTLGWEIAQQRAPIPPDLKPVEEQLGTRQIDGVTATGRRSATTIPAGRIGNDRAIQIVEEQWESPELNMVVSSRFSDPRTGVVEYRLTNINRSEPRADLFAVPSDYTVVGPGAAYQGAIRGAAGQPAQPGQPGQRSGRGN